MLVHLIAIPPAFTYFFSAFSFFAICSISLGLSSARTLSTMLARDSPSSEESAASSTEPSDKSTDPPCPSDKGGATASEEGRDSDDGRGSEKSCADSTTGTGRLV